MFSNISEAWANDPVKEMTDKLSKGAFGTHTNRGDIFNLKKTNPTEISLSDNTSASISLFSENTINQSPFSPIRFNKTNKKTNRIHHPSLRITDTDTNSDQTQESISSSDNFADSKCSYSVKHLKKCNRCYNKLKKLINGKLTKKVDEIILDTKMKQIQNASMLQQPTQPVQALQPDSWRETLIIIVGAVIAIFIIFLIVKCLNK